MEMEKLNLIEYLSEVTRKLKEYAPDITEKDIHNILGLNGDDGAAIFNVIQALIELENITEKNNPLIEVKELLLEMREILNK